MTKGDSKASPVPSNKSGDRFPRRWLLIMVLVAGLNFLLGLLVGRGTPPLRFDIQALERELAGLRQVEVQARIKRFRVAMEGLDNRQPLDFYHALEQDDKVNPPSPGPTKRNDVAAAPKPAPTVSAIVKPKPPANGKGPMVQVAALRQADKADKIVARLRALGFAVRSVPVKTADRGTFYRVRVGPFNDRQAAVETRDRLLRLNYDAIVVDP